MEIRRGRQNGAIKVCVYGPEGIGKSTFAAQFPEPIFIDTEGSTAHMDVARTPRPKSFTELQLQVDYFIQHSGELKTLVIDTGDWAERLNLEEICAQMQIKGIEDVAYGRGYTFAAEAFGRLLDKLETLKQKGVNIVINCHAMMRKFEQPDEMGQYDRWELKLSKKAAPMLKEFVDMLLFATYKTVVVNVDGQGAAKGKNKASGGKRVMYASHHPCWDAKNRFGLPDEMPFSYESIRAVIEGCTAETRAEGQNLRAEPPKAEERSMMEPEAKPAAEPLKTPETASTPKAPLKAPASAAAESDRAMLKLYALMQENEVSKLEVQAVVAKTKVYPADMPIEKYDPMFITGAIIPKWESILNRILETREKQPF